MRRQVPGQYYLFTTRCHQARFFLRPDRSLNAAVLEWLARGQGRFAGIRIHAVCVMSNHLHIVLRDDFGDLAHWASYFLGNLARAVNRIRGRSGAFFERRYSAEPILDVEALHDRLVYVVANPVRAHLCKRASEWPGVVLFANGPEPEGIPVSWIDREVRRKAEVGSNRGGGTSHAASSSFVEATLVIHPIPAIDTRDAATVSASIEARERLLALERARIRRRTLTLAQVLAQSWRSAPRRSNRSPRPLCHASDPVIRSEFKRGFADFVSIFREASQRLREGVLGVAFPEWSFPPGNHLVRAV